MLEIQGKKENIKNVSTEERAVFVLLMFFSFSVVSVSVEVVMVFEKVEFNMVYFRREGL